MNAFPVPFRITATAILSGILLIVGLWNFYDRSHLTVPTDGVFWSETDGKLSASEISPGSAASVAGIRPGDRLDSINNIKIENRGQFIDLIYELGPGSTAVYRIENENGPRDVNIRIDAQSMLTARDGLRLILAFLYLGIGIFVLFRGAGSSRTYHFYFICLTAFVVFLFSYTPALNSLDWWVYAFSVVSLLILPALFVHFCLRFPVDTPIKFPPFLLYVPAFSLILFQGFWLTGHLARFGLPRSDFSSNLIDDVHLGYFAIGFLAGAFLLLMKRFKTLDKIAQQQMKWIGYGTVAGILPFSFFYILPEWIGMRTNLAMESSLLSLAFIPLSIGYALIHFRLMDVERIARKGIAYFLASSMLLALYLLFVLLLGRAAQWIAPQTDFMVICLVVLFIAFLFAPLRNAIQDRLDRRFYKDSFEDRSSLMDFAQKLSSEINLEPLSRSIADRVSITFRIERVAVFLADPVHRGFFRLTYSRDPDLYTTPSLFREDELFDNRTSAGSLKNRYANQNLQPANPLLVQRGFLHILELKLHGRSVGVIALGELSAGGHLSTEDEALLSTLAGYASMALENANLYRSVENKAIELEQLKTYTENIIESINVAVLALDSSGCVSSCNRAFEDLYGTNRRNIVGSQIEVILPVDVLKSIEKISGVPIWDIRSPVNMVKLFLKNSLRKQLFVNMSCLPLNDSFGENSGTLIVLDDITEKAELEQQLLQAEKLSSIGLLAAGIAHEINTPIAGISSYTQLLLKDLPQSDKRKKILEKIENQTFRAAEIVNGLLNFSRTSGSEFRDLDINQLINESLVLLNHQLQESRIKVESRFDPSLPTVYGNSGKLQQVFINLFLNARDAMPSGGNLLIETAMNESMIVIDISDTGTGISEENRKRIFDPFFTTKDVGKGTGLGLSVSYGIIQEHGGRILVDSISGKGTHFKLKLPSRLQ